ncbi:MAG: ribonuclease Y [Patescibacteria group bacterium]|nr:ribonuclease Y [Patescibacteria group bacterium]
MYNLIIYLAAAAVGGVTVGYVLRIFIARKKHDLQEQKQKEILLKAKDEALKIKEGAAKEEERARKDLQELEKNLRRREEMFDKRLESLEVEKNNILSKEKEIENIKKEIAGIKDKQNEALQKITKLNKDEALKILLSQIEKEYKEDLIRKIKEQKEIAKEEAQTVAREILSTVIQRLASEHTVETTTTAVSLPSDEMKGRIIGREGRNIQIFEKETGTDLIIDDTPDTVVISAFDPIRRHVAKVALEKLIADGRIHPTRIEEVVQKAKDEIGQEIKEAGEAAAYEVGVAGLHPDLLKILGRLKFRTSYGQNVLQHSIESAQVASMLASELGADVNLAKKASLLHDIGKAVDHDIPGAHHHISVDICKKYGLSESICDAIASHHDDIEIKSVEGIIVKAADAISSSRPGARRETFENYVKRLEELENIANSFPGVEKTYAIQAGREVRIIVKPEEIDDLTAIKLSKDIAKKIEEDLQYPGTIKVNVIRETRAIEFAK